MYINFCFLLSFKIHQNYSGSLTFQITLHFTTQHSSLKTLTRRTWRLPRTSAVATPHLRPCTAAATPPLHRCSIHHRTLHSFLSIRFRCGLHSFQIFFSKSPLDQVQVFPFKSTFYVPPRCYRSLHSSYCENLASVLFFFC